VLDASADDEGRWEVLKNPNGVGEASGDGTARAFNELLRRPAPNYHLLDLRR
jgi:hypothetical protein